MKTTTTTRNRNGNEKFARSKDYYVKVLLWRAERERCYIVHESCWDVYDAGAIEHITFAIVTREKTQLANQNQYPIRDQSMTLNSTALHLTWLRAAERLFAAFFQASPMGALLLVSFLLAHLIKITIVCAFNSNQKVLKSRANKRQAWLQP